jgi:hypothetical protein
VSSFGERDAFAPQPATRQVGHLRGIRVAGDQRAQHGTARDAHDVTGDRAQLDVRVVQHLVNPIDRARTLVQERRPVTRQIPEVANGRRGAPLRFDLVPARRLIRIPPQALIFIVSGRRRVGDMNDCVENPCLRSLRSLR